eukprot:scaffold1752_cov197-Alexandrium_tamarense.AAC.18
MHQLLTTASLLVGPIYLTLTIAALLSLVSPTLNELASHGKTRQPSMGVSCAPKPKTKQRTKMLSILSNDRFTVNKARFVDFYSTGIVTTTFLVYHALYVDQYSKDNIDQWLSSTCLLLTHLIRRFCECMWVQNSQFSSRMHLSGYLLGVVHYLCLPFVFVPLVVERSEGNGSCRLQSSIQSRYLTSIAMIGCLYFQYQQYRHHSILASLRSRNTASAKKSSYSIPSGGLFEYVTCPHYMSEIMIYFMFAGMLALQSKCGCVGGDEVKSIVSATPFKVLGNGATSVLLRLYNSTHWIVLLWVATNLSISANKSHAWYLNQFGEVYPINRKRLLPLFW